MQIWKGRSWFIAGLGSDCFLGWSGQKFEQSALTQLNSEYEINLILEKNYRSDFTQKKKKKRFCLQWPPLFTYFGIMQGCAKWEWIHQFYDA